MRRCLVCKERYTDRYRCARCLKRAKAKEALGLIKPFRFRVEA